MGEHCRNCLLNFLIAFFGYYDHLLEISFPQYIYCYLQIIFYCRDCIVNEWKEDADDEQDEN